MTRRVVASTLVGAAILFACAPRVGRVNGESKPPADTRSTRQQIAARANGGIEASLSHAAEDHTATFSLTVTNTGERTEVRFPNGMTHEFIVLDDRDREIWRSSTGRLFTQALQTKQLKPGSELRYEAKWDDALPGEYRVVAMLNSDTHPRRVEHQLVVR